MFNQDKSQTAYYQLATLSKFKCVVCVQKRVLESNLLLVLMCVSTVCIVYLAVLVLMY